MEDSRCIRILYQLNRGENVPTGIVTDSTCDLPEEIIKQNNIHVIPLSVSFGEQVFRDNIDLSAEDFYNKLNEEDTLPGTSQPAVGEFVKLYQKLSTEYESIISLHLSSNFSGTYDSARLAAEQVADCDINVIDTRSVSLGLGFLALKAAELRDEDYPPEMIIDIINENLHNILIYFTVSSLEYLEKGGRIGRGRAFIGSIFNINPILGVCDGEVAPVEKARGGNKTYRKIRGLMTEELRGVNEAWVGILAGKNGEVAGYRRKLYQYLKDMEKDIRIISTLPGPAIGTHTGPEVYGTVIFKGIN